jgi:pimeloyl-ACP methyl ester carboxylesterase
MNIIVQGLATAYRSEGAGPVVLLLHGWGDKGATFNLLVQDLAQTHHVVTLDLPGFGASERPHEAWGLQDYTAFVRDFLQKAGLQAQTIIGHSNGAAIAIYGLGEGILQAEKLIVIGGAGIRDATTKKQALSVGAKAMKVLMWPLPHATKHRLRRKLYGSLGSDYLSVPGMEETFKKVVAEDVQAQAARVAIPTLLIYGSEDEATPVSFGEIYASGIRGSKLSVIQGAGHFVHQTNSAEVSKLVRGFLQ